MLTIYWKSGVSKGYTNLLPSRWFESEGERPFLIGWCQTGDRPLPVEFRYRPEAATEVRSIACPVMSIVSWSAR